MKYTREIATCLRCRIPIDNNNNNDMTPSTNGGKKMKTAVCKECRPYMVNTYLEIQNERNYIEKKYSRAWTHCQTCQGSLHQEILCNNYDCSLFYLRRRLQLDLNKLQNKLSRFDINDEESEEEIMTIEEEQETMEVEQIF